jgi:uncharacterized membrane protein/phage FluMu protein Com
VISFTCQFCRKRFRVDDRHAGRNANCPACFQSLVVPAAELKVPDAGGQAVGGVPDIETWSENEFGWGPSEQFSVLSAKKMAEDSVTAAAIRCPHCDVLLPAPPNNADQKCFCPTCKQLIEPVLGGTHQRTSGLVAAPGKLGGWIRLAWVAAVVPPAATLLILACLFGMVATNDETAAVTLAAVASASALVAVLCSVYGVVGWAWGFGPVHNRPFRLASVSGLASVTVVGAGLYVAAHWTIYFAHRFEEKSRRHADEVWRAESKWR